MGDNNTKTPPLLGKLDRRKFIKAGAAAAVVAGAASTCGRDAVYKDKYPAVSENDVSLMPNGKSVLILGGGFGGMHAACELLDRGFAVTIIEKSNMLGGKLKSWRDRTFGVPPLNDPNWKGYPRDHGCHAVWGFYNNLREFMRRHNYKMWDFPRETSIYNFVDRDGTGFQFGNRPTWPWPFSRFQMFSDMQGPMAKLTGGHSDSRAALLKIASFDYDDLKQRMYLDSISFPEWARSVGIPEIVTNKFFGPMTDMAMFDSVDKTSALYTLMLMSLVLGNNEDLDVDIFMHPPGETYVDPIVKYIKDRGGQLIFNTPVVKINRDGDRIRSVLAGDIDDASMAGQKKWKCKVCGSVFASPTHPNRCPVCGSPGSEIVAFSAGPAREYVADHYILAMDTPGAKEVIARSNFLGTEYFDNIMKLDKTSVYVTNIWYSNCKSWTARFPNHFCAFPSNFKFLGITLNWAYNWEVNGRKDIPPLVPDYQGKDIAVIETQICNTDMVAGMTDEQIVRLAHEELKIMMPDLPEPTDFYINRWDTYSPQRVGYEALRPKIQSPFDNLFLIGDWVRTDHLSVYMEKTNVSAKMAVNHILEKIGQREGRIKILRSGTPSSIIEGSKLLFDIYP